MKDYKEKQLLDPYGYISNGCKETIQASTIPFTSSPQTPEEVGIKTDSGWFMPATKPLITESKRVALVPMVNNKIDYAIGGTTSDGTVAFFGMGVM